MSFESNPLVSVVVPVFNAENTLERCILSILRQTWKDLDIVLVDDGSTDSSRRICEGFQDQDERVRVIRTTNGGVSRARNVGISHALGDFVQFVDSDDYLEPDLTQRLVKGQLSCGADFVATGVMWVDSRTGDRTSKALPASLVLDRDRFFDSLYELEALWFTNSPVAKLYRMELILLHDLRFSEGLNLGEDAIFNFSYFERSERFLVLPGVGYNYVRYGEGTLTSNTRRDAFQMVPLQLKVRRAFVDLSETAEQRNRREYDYSMFIVRSVVPRLAAATRLQDYRRYSEWVGAMRRDDIFVRQCALLDAPPGGSKVVSKLFKWRRFGMIFLALHANRAVRRFLSKCARVASGLGWKRSCVKIDYSVSPNRLRQMVMALRTTPPR